MNESEIQKKGQKTWAKSAKKPMNQTKQEQKFEKGKINVEKI